MRRWWEEKESQVVASAVATRAHDIHTSLSSWFEWLRLLDRLYDTYGQRSTTGLRSRRTQVVQNVIASTADTLAAAIGSREVTPRLLTDDAPWSERRKAKKRGLYMEGLGKHVGLPALAAEAFKYCAIKGLSALKVQIRSNRLRVEYVPVNRLLVPDYETRDGQVLELIHYHWRDRRQLQAEFPRHREVLENVTATWGELEAEAWDYREDNVYSTWDGLLCYEAWRLPVGTPGERGYQPGRHVLCVDSYVLWDEKWEDDDFPLTVMRWSTRPYSWYGIGGGHRVVGHQLHMNRSNRLIDAQLRQIAHPTTYVHTSDMNLAPRATNELGTIAAYNNRPPVTVLPPAVSPEVYNRTQFLHSDAYREIGVSELQATARKPAGLDSGAALREYRDAQTGRFAQQEKAYEAFYLDTLFRLYKAARKMGALAPTVTHAPKFGKRTIVRYKLSDVDEEIIRAQLSAVSPLARDPAGRKQLALELAQAGVISMDEARHLMEHPDIEGTWSLYNAALDDIDATIERILDGATEFPEPHQNLELGKWRMQQTYLRVRHENAPDEVLEALTLWTAQASWMLSKAQTPATPAAPLPGEELTAQAPHLAVPMQPAAPAAF